MGNFGTKPKPKADTNVPKRPSGNIHCTLYPSPSPTHTQPPIHAACPLPVCSVELYMSVSLYLYLYLFFLCVCVCVQCPTTYVRLSLATCHLAGELGAQSKRQCSRDLFPFCQPENLAYS